MLSSIEISRKRRDQRPLHSLTYRLAARRVLHERSIANLLLVLGFSYVAALSSQYVHLGLF
ncbi:hypothetical protein BX616_002580, partial [Lobosporangium transversale]